jgi:arabinofuranosyltransferase
MTTIVDDDTPVEPVAPASTRGQRIVRAIPAYVPALIVLIGGWQYRWLDEDAFINFRIVDQIFHGNGPVFNAGERVEAATSPAWLGVLVVGRGVFGPFADINWITIVLGLAAAVAAFVVAGAAARLVHRGEPGVVVPVGALLVSTVAVTWEFATSGLEMGLVWLWLATAWLALVWAARSPSCTGWRRIAFCIAIGSAPLVRPELGVTMVCVLVAWFWLVRPRRIVPDVVAIFALPVAYELFRMGYYATIVPNTGLAKDAGGLHAGQGWDYLTDFVKPYHLWLPLVLVAATIVIRHVTNPDRRLLIATVAMVVGGVLEGAYIVAIGGDYMHGRLLLPAFFAIALPASARLSGVCQGSFSDPDRRPARVRAATIVVVSLAAVWALVGIAFLRPPTPPPGRGFGPADIADWRTVTGAAIEPGDIALGVNGNEARAQYDAGVRGYFKVTDKKPRPGNDPNAYVITLGSIGVPAYHAGPNVWVIDIGGLAEPLAARTDPIPGRQAGHRKQIDDAWYDARFGVVNPDDPKAVAASKALQCGDVKKLLEAVDGKLTPGRFFSNMLHSFSFTRLKVPADPVAAEQKFCGNR